MKPILYIMVGLPGSGKSTFALKHFNNDNTIYVSRDSVRLAIITDEDRYFSKEKVVFKTFIEMIAAILKAGKNCCADATHLNYISRKKLINALSAKELSLEQYNIIFIYMNTNVKECIRRDSHRTGRCHVTEQVILDMASNLEKPTFDEFNNIVEIWSICHKEQ